MSSGGAHVQLGDVSPPLDPEGAPALQERQDSSEENDGEDSFFSLAQPDDPEGLAPPDPLPTEPAPLRKRLAASLCLNVILSLCCVGLGLQLSSAAWAALFGVPAASLLAYSNGANDCANSVGTPYSVVELVVRAQAQRGAHPSVP